MTRRGEMGVVGTGVEDLPVQSNGLDTFSMQGSDRQLMTNSSTGEPHSISGTSPQTQGHPTRRQRYDDPGYPTLSIEIDKTDGITHVHGVHRFAGYDPQPLVLFEFGPAQQSEPAAPRCVCNGNACGNGAAVRLVEYAYAVGPRGEQHAALRRAFGAG
jgi:hypothetical protein